MGISVLGITTQVLMLVQQGVPSILVLRNSIVKLVSSPLSRPIVSLLLVAYILTNKNLPFPLSMESHGA